MTPSEKAKELVEKFLPLAHKNFTMKNDGEKDKAKQCALICAKECHNAAFLTASPVPEKTVGFWSEVIKEIENL